ncbi:hypothetical protein B4U84_04880 [Westiellopsis prolifica IICB1]|nr:hypothetical protein B4U84_04880 [Westiellopsis prolifica IICB1]
MKSLLKYLRVIDKLTWKTLPSIIPLSTSLLTISASVGIGITFNPQRSWASACAGVYFSRSGVPTSSQSVIGYYNSITKSYVNIATYDSGGNINAIATQPSTGNLFFVNRVTGKTVVYNPNTGSQITLTGTLPGTTTTIIGATFNASGKLYVYYSNKTLIEVNPATGSQVGSTINISGIPGNNDSTSRITNGDIAIGTDGVLYAVGDTSSNSGSYTSQLYSITISGTTATATPVNGNNLITGVSGAAVNGLAIDPSTSKFYISTSGGTYELNTSTKVATLLTSAVGTNDLAACGSPAPDLPTITKTFSPSTVTGVPATSTLTLTLGNTNSVPIYLIQTLIDNFQSGLTVSNPNGLSGTCTTISGNTVTATAGSSSISLNNGFKIPAGGCTVSVNVTASSAGTYTNIIAAGALKTFVGDNASAASSTLVVATTISGTLYEDTDGGNDLDATEPKLPANITVKLLDSNNNLITSTTTNTNGTYIFTGVTSGNYKIQVDTTDTDIPPGYTLGTPNNLAVTVSGSSLTNQNFGFDKPVSSNPNILLVKRITAINESSFTDFIDGVNNNNSPNYVPTPRDTDDNNSNWQSNYLQGLINGGTVRPNDEVEYTVYFLSAGDATAPKVLMCDRIPNNVTFIPTTFNSFPTKNSTGLEKADRGILWQYSGNTESLSNIKDGDIAQYFSPGEDPTDVYPTVDCGGANTNGAIVVNLGDLPNAIAPGTPTDSYGFIRFRGRVK